MKGLISVVSLTETSLLPSHGTFFLLPSWLAGLALGSTLLKHDLVSELRSIPPEKKQLSPSHSLFTEEWEFRDDLSLPMAYIFLDPSELNILFYKHMYPTLYESPRDATVSSVFQRPENKELDLEIEQRLHASAQHRQYFKEHKLYDEEAEKLRQRIL